MPKVKVDGIEVEVPQGATVLKVFKDLWVRKELKVQLELKAQLVHKVTKVL